MRRVLVTIALCLTALTAFAKNDWKGKVVDENGEPVAYANVAVLSRADSTVVCGAVTAEDGTFNIVTQETDGIMMVAMLGYQTAYFTPKDGAVIVLKNDNAMLTQATVQAIMPKTKLTGEGLQTNVKGSVLENAGSAKDVLGKTPGIIKGQDGLEVIGKGAPLVYINGHKVTDATELDRLQSNEIQSVEVINNPGAQYDATVQAVVRIKTIKRQGDGFGFNLDTYDEQSLRWLPGNDAHAALNANYRTGGVDIFGGINYDYGTYRQLSYAETASYGVSDLGEQYVFQNKGDIDGAFFGHHFSGNAGVNWQLANDHFLGGKVEWRTNTTDYNQTLINSKVYENGTLVDKLSTTTEDVIGPRKPFNLGANLYYNGVIGKLGVDVNLDYYGTDASTRSVSKEFSDMTTDADIASIGLSSGRMWAGKAVLSYPVWMGQLQLGTEETFSRRTDSYSVEGVAIQGSDAKVKEDNIAGFASYGCYIPNVGQLSAGLRFEHVHYVFDDAVSPELNVDRNYNNWFPTVSYANVFGPVQLLVNYSAKTQRPGYSMLSGAVRYNNRYIWQSGNPQLQPVKMHNVGVTAVWKFISLIVNYIRTDNAIMMWSTPYNDQGVVMVRPENIPTPYRNLSVYTSFTPTIGPWNLNWVLGFMPQWLTIRPADPREPDGYREISFNDKPVLFVQANNTLTVKGGWQFELGGMVMSKGYMQNMYRTNTYVDLSAAIQKKLLKDGSLVLRLEGSDLLGAGHFDMETDFGSHTILQNNLMDTQRIKFSLRYNFNAAKSKYRGTGAGSDEKSRM